MGASSNAKRDTEIKDLTSMEQNMEPATLNLSQAEIVDKPEMPNPFDPASLRIDPSQDIELGAKKLITSVDVRKPSPQDFFRTHPGADYRMLVAIVELKGTREIYAVVPAVANLIPDEIKRVELRLYITRAGVISLWPVAVPTSDGRENAWHTSARFAAEAAETRWVRLKSNTPAGRYDVLAAPVGLPDPIWPEIDFAELLRLAFGGGKLIDSLDHPVIKSLKGQI